MNHFIKQISIFSFSFHFNPTLMNNFCFEKTNRKKELITDNVMVFFFHFYMHFNDIPLTRLLPKTYFLTKLSLLFAKNYTVYVQALSARSKFTEFFLVSRCGDFIQCFFCGFIKWFCCCCDSGSSTGMFYIFNSFLYTRIMLMIIL